MATNEHNRKMQILGQMRAKTALNLKASGMTWEEVGKALGVSRQRAHQMALKYSNQAHAETPAASAPSAPYYGAAFSYARQILTLGQ